ncbi:hypothetical protein [Wansuia hejianensis]|uniref:Uncharacterized protein n=1 Tax=Wansuia hejianensis TaxID=2763667 RepID=A0A926EYB4_9FIRM|nr:hypothetical protein [Wansuia hejianensis]MBC8589791.1 hypothetical protein [Wansuia hejianensis]
MKRKGLMSTIMGTMAFAPSIINSMTGMKKTMKKTGKDISKMAKKGGRKRNMGSLITTGILGYGIAHLMPVKSLIRGNNLGK